MCVSVGHILMMVAKKRGGEACRTGDAETVSGVVRETSGVRSRVFLSGGFCQYAVVYGRGDRSMPPAGDAGRGCGSFLISGYVRSIWKRKKRDYGSHLQKCQL